MIAQDQKTARGSAVRGATITEELRAEIVSGALPPGSQMPTRSDTEKRFGTTPVTVQRAFDQLVREEFVIVVGKRTYVAIHPPHLSRYALVFPVLPSEPSWGPFWTALSREAHGVEKGGALRLPAYCGVNGLSNNPDLHRLAQDVQSQRVAGLIFMSDPQQLDQSPILTQGGLPRVAIMAGESRTGFPVVHTDNHSMLDRSLQRFKEQGCRRLAVLQTPRWLPPHHIQARAIASGFEFPAYWNLRVNLGTVDALREYTHLLFNGNQLVRPDALLVADDNFAEAVLQGLQDAGVQPGRDVAVIAHCNFTRALPQKLPFERIGFDARALLSRCVESINDQRRGENVKQSLKIPALFASEIPYL